MKFSQEELKAIQRPQSPHYELSATYSVCLTMENDSRVYEEVNRRRRVDGTTTAHDLKPPHSGIGKSRSSTCHKPPT